MFRSLRSRLFLTYVLITVIVLVLVALSLLFLFLTPNPITQQLEFRRLEFWITQFIDREARLLQGVPQVRMSGIVNRVSQATRARTLILDQDQGVIADSRPGEEPLPENILSQVVDSTELTRGTYRYSLTDRWLFVASQADEKHWLVLTVPQPTLRGLGLVATGLVRTLSIAGLIALLLSIVFAWVTASWVASPLAQMASASKAVADGDFDQQLPLKGPREVRSLAISFNEMVQKVQSSGQAQRDFVANVSHELKTPLTSIQGFAQAILDGTATETEGQQRAAQVIHEESDRLHRLVENLLDLARIDAGQVTFEKQPVDLNALLNGVVERLSIRTSDRDVRIELRLPELPSLIGDGDRLAQVFTNLIDNAVKHTPGGEKVSLIGEIEAGWVTIHVDDRGDGIPPDELARIFERFYQLDKARAGGRERGVGLGLAITREIVQIHGGRVVAQSVLGRGSRFSVQLPVVRPDDTTLVRKKN